MEDDMQEHHHTRTTPGEPVAPEIVPHAVRPEPGGTTQAEDINIPLVAVCVLGFAVFLVVTIVSLQAWFYNADNAEHDAKWRPDSALTVALDQYQHDLHDPAGPNTRLAPEGSNAGGAAIRRTSIDDAIAATVKDYAGNK
jgi:hypothetical protein